MAITMATMGRLMKNLDTWKLLPCQAGGLPHPGKRFGVYLHAGTNLLHTLGDDALTRLQTLVNDPHFAHLVTRLHVPDAHLIAAVHDGNLVAALQLGNGPLRDQEGARIHSGPRPDSGIYSGAQDVTGVCKEPGDAYRSSRGIYLARRAVDSPFARIDRTVC